MRDLEKLMEYVSSEEDKYYEFSQKSFHKGNQLAFMVHQAEASAFQRVRYVIEQLMEERTQREREMKGTTQLEEYIEQLEKDSITENSWVSAAEKQLMRDIAEDLTKILKGE